MISCKNCNRRFANKNSLQSHRSKFHQIMPTASRVGYADAAGSIVEENTSEQSDSEDERNRNLDNGTELDLDGNDQDYAMTNEADEQTSDDSSGEVLIPKKDTLTSDTNSADTTNEFDQFSTRKRNSVQNKRFSKRMRNNSWTKENVFDLLSSIEDSVNKHTNKTETPFDLFGSFRMKKEFFANLHEFFGTQVLLEKTLTDDESLLVDAVLDTISLDEITRLLNANVIILRGIIEKTKSKENN